MNLRLQIAAQITVLFLLQLCFQNEVETATLPLRCQCVHSINGLNPKMIKNFHIFPKTAHCSKIEIILTAHQGHEESEACLNPESRQGKRLQKCWESIQKNANKKRDCLQRKKRKGSKQKKRGRRGGNTRSKRRQV
ncbi:C-X-C motif chemokine 2-like [Hemiscyllium ocellatum]|uniref:C-X-C motif chemokine 2-like n=1 Tax=Hemiscyllium ocellatum TaxID=170820 RepID=UPI002965F27D|nr:C-X-C motif chemokine 2-like [Hemiscyllium ocellatum]